MFSLARCCGFVSVGFIPLKSALSLPFLPGSVCSAGIFELQPAAESSSKASLAHDLNFNFEKNSSWRSCFLINKIRFRQISSVHDIISSVLQVMDVFRGS